MKSLTANALRHHSSRIVFALRYPTYQRLALQRLLLPAAGSIITGVGNLCTVGASALHGASFGTMTVHVVAMVIVAPIGDKKAGI
jgi:hypothetical protein